MTLPWDLPLYLAIPYWIGFAVCWRTLTGHVAWSIHKSARENRTIRPPVENWLTAAVPCALISFLWIAVLLFAIPWRPLTRGAEREAEVELARVSFDNMMLETERKAKALGVGEREHVGGEVVE